MRLPAQASRYALAFAGRDSRAKNVPLERFLNALHFKRAGYGRHQVSSAFFVWCACLLKLRAAHLLSQDAGNEPVARFGAQFHWNVFLTHSTSSARGRRVVCSFLWEIKLRRKKALLKAAPFLFWRRGVGDFVLHNSTAARQKMWTTLLDIPHSSSPAGCSHFAKRRCGRRP